MDPQDAIINPLTHLGLEALQVRLKFPASGVFPHTTLDWAAEFRRLANKSKAGTFELANAAYLTRKFLAHGEWTTLWRSRTVPFSKTRGEALVRIGERFGIPNVQTSARLPTEWTILHQLARLKLSLIEALLAQKLIHPGLTYKEARELVVSIVGTRPLRSARTRVQQRFGRLRDSVRECAGQLNCGDRDELAAQLEELANELTLPKRADVCTFFKRPLAT